MRRTIFTLVAAGLLLDGAGLRAANTNQLAAPGTGRKQLSVLFIGNSYSFELPAVFERLAAAAGKRVNVSQATTGGLQLRQHLERGDARAMVARKGWDVVVLQEQSQTPSFPEAQVRTAMDPAVAEWKRRSTQAGAKVVMFAAWAHVGGDRQNFPNDTFDTMQQRLDATFRRLQREQAVGVAPVGAAWVIARKAKPGLALHTPDGSHPAPAGVYLAACVFYAALFEESPAKLGTIKGVDAATAVVLRQAAERAVLEWRSTAPAK